MTIRDSVAFITGANRGIGLAFAQALLAKGAKKVYAAARNPETVKLAGVHAVRLDVTKPDEVVAAARTCGDVSLLINNAGISLRSSFLGADGMSAARSVMETNYFGPLAVSRAFAPVLVRNGGGVIVNVLSALSWVTLPTSGTYSASKSAAWALTNGLRTELRGQGTQVLGLHVAFVDTDMARHVSAPKATPAEVVRQVLTALEAGREEVLADELTRQIKAGLSDDLGVYLNFDPSRAFRAAS
jgi:NAD(P)-dependent dehydrogenase (short-subunit alcohol dehydrogenase family)